MREARQAAAGLSQLGRPRVAGQRPDLGLGQADFLQRAADAPFARGILAGPVVAQIVGVGAVHQAGIAVRQRIGQQLIQVVALAEIAAVRRVGPVGRIVQLRGGQDDVLHAQTGGDGAGRLELGARHAGGIGGQRQRPVTERVAGDSQDERAVGAARIGYGDRSHLGQDRAQPDKLILHQGPHSPAEAISGDIIAQPGVRANFRR